ncbi:reduced viability upon starvation protein-like protein [Calycina marina]|uniref:Reduced viability upon starvation protein-like protein n=1 Tax=Calycina marina TaxID=1763456 RepID=A0A9P7YZT5_9HELO|nr:reduced viability upon starvation protein-like protein [Calycina marina]
MSFKGFQKSVVRAPQTFKAKFNLGEITKDAVYLDAERRFQELETETKKLHNESKKYFEAINGMMSHQIEFSQAIAEIYLPISGRLSDPDSIISEGNPEGIRACEEYEAIVKDLQATLQPELEMIETRVIKPADELLEVVKVIRKSALKRDHKQLDYDRHRATLKKLQDKKEKTLKDEKALYKAENDCEQATQEYNYFNDLLKDELPKLFSLEREFIRPLFQSFYYMQLNVFYTLHEKMQGCDIGYFNLTLDIEEAFEAKRGEIQQAAEALSIVKFKTTGAKRFSKYGGGRLAIEDRKSAGGSSGRLAIEPGPSRYGSSIVAEEDDQPGKSASLDYGERLPPPYSSSLSPTSGGVVRAASTGGNWGAAAKKKGPAPPPPKPKPSRLSGVPQAETVTALYDYEAQAEGDLSFTAGDVIEIVTKTDNNNEWWIGKINGRQGQFPGNYVQ